MKSVGRLRLCEHCHFELRMMSSMDQGEVTAKPFNRIMEEVKAILEIQHT